MKLAIGICNNGVTISSDFFWNFNAIIKPSNCQIMLFRGNSRSKAASLNEITENALSWGAEAILYLDYDMSFPQDTIIKLLAHNKPLVSGLYYLKSPPFSPVAGYSIEKDGQRILTNQDKNTIWKYDFKELPEPDESGLVEVEWAGIGCLLVRKEVFTIIEWEKNKFYDVWNFDKGIRSYGHDINLCFDAAKKGIKTYVDKTVACGHLGVFDIDEEFIRAFYNSGMNLKWIEEIKKTKSNPNYWDRMWRLENINSTNRTYSGEFDFIVNYIPKNSKVVDVGCGIGYLLNRLKNEKKCKCFGYDFSKIAIEKLKNYCKIDGDVNNLLNWKYSKNINYYDFVISSHVLEHFEKENVYIIMEVLKKLAKKGGKIIIIVPAVMPQGCVDVCLEHKIQYTETTFKELMEKYFKEPILGRAGHSMICIGINN